MSIEYDRHEQARKTLARLNQRHHLVEWEVIESMFVLRILHGHRVGFRLEAVALSSE